MLRMLATVASLALVLCAAGCEKEHENLIATGRIVSVTLWEKPPVLGATGENGGFPVPKDSRVEIYSNLIIVTTADGLSHVSPNGFYTNLVFTPD